MRPFNHLGQTWGQTWGQNRGQSLTEDSLAEEGFRRRPRPG